MKKAFALAGVITMLPLGLGAKVDHAIARFDGAIGVLPVVINPLNSAQVVNTVRGIGPGVFPWTIRSLRARLDGDGDFKARGEGLVLAFGGPAPIGTRGDIAAVRALLFCGTSTAPHVSEPGGLDLGGNFRIEGKLTPAAGPDCLTPTLLIALGAGTAQAPFRWLVAGIPDVSDSN
jgi:hypothetical protein